MNPAFRTIFAISAGVATGLILISLGQALSPYQPSGGIDYNNPVAYSEWIKSLPDAAFGILLVTYLIACLTGGFVTVWLSPPVSFPPSFATGFILLFYNIVTVLAFPNPPWMSYSSCIGCVAMALSGGWLAQWIKRTWFAS